MRTGLLIGVVFTVVMSFGYAFEEGRWSYRFLFDYVPGFSGSRTPGRLFTLTSLGLSLLAAGATQWIGENFARGRGRRIARAVAPLMLTAIILVEGMGRLALPVVPEIPAGQIGITAPALHLPTDEFNDTTYMYWSTAGFTPIVNGQSGFVPALLERIRAEMPDFPSPETVSLLRSVGVDVVVLHPQFTPGTLYEATASRPIEGLGMTREDRGDVILYRLQP